MLRSDLARLLEEQGGFTKQEATALVNAFLESMAEALVRGESIEIRGFGSLVVREYAGYLGSNPRTAESMSVDPRRGVLFRPGKGLRDRVNGSPPTG